MPVRKAKKKAARRKVRPRRPAEETRREILEAAQRLLAEGGPETIRLQEIARIVGVSHPAILHHFGSREGLMGALEDHVTNLLAEDVGRVLLRGTPIEGDEPSGQDLIQAVAVAMDDRRLAPLLAWLVLRQDDDSESSGDASALVGRVVELIHYRLAEERHRPSQRVPSHEEIGFTVRLVVVAMFGDALIGEDLGQAELGERAKETRRFRSWLADLAVGQLSRDPTQPVD
jgi:AcrR family transcriptional regulator